MLTGKVVDKEGKPLKAEIHGESINVPGHAGLKFKSAESGDFSTERWNDKMHILAFDAVNRLAAFQQIEADTEAVTLELLPVASLMGSMYAQLVGSAYGTLLLRFDESPSSSLTKPIAFTITLD